ncbi:MAG: hypothetical protein ABEJ93_03805 [Candidatus Nanohalobium sp.]
MIEQIGFQRPFMLVTGLTSLIGLYLVYKGSGREEKLIGLLKIGFFLLVAVSLAGPFLQHTAEVQEEVKPILLKDNSRSAQLIEENQLPEGLNAENILSANQSNLASAMKTELRPNRTYILVSDGQTSEDLEPVLDSYREAGSTVSVLKPDMRSEKSVYIQGPSNTVPGAENSFQVTVSGTESSEETVKVVLDNKTIFEGSVNGSWEFSRSFDSKGVHRLKASIQNSDRFEENNRYFKTVEVQKKPEILYIGEENSLVSQLQNYYDVDVRQTVPEDLSKYYAIFSTREISSNRLSRFVSRGGGYVRTGSYETAEDFVPVRPSNENYNSKNTRVVIAIESSSQPQGSIKGSKELAYSLVKALPANTKLASLYYSEEANLLTSLKTLAFNRQKVLERISSRFKTKLEARHDVGLKAAKKVADGEGNIVLFTDGNFHEGPKNIVKQPAEVRKDALATAESLEADLYVVGAGRNPNTDFLKELAERAGGEYMAAEDAWELGFRFGAGGGSSEFKPLVAVDSDHFITEGLNLGSRASLFDEVKPRPTSDVLVSGPGEREFLVTWRYGLGRVAAFTGGQPGLDNLLRTDPGLVLRTASWAVGNPERKKEKWIEVEGAEAPQKPEVTASYPMKGLRYDAGRYEASLNPEGLGFHSFRGRELYSYNYNSEIKELGYDMDQLKEIASKTGGKIYSPGQIDVEELSSQTTVQRTSKTSLTLYCVAAALIVFLLDVGFRKLNGRK